MEGCKKRKLNGLLSKMYIPKNIYVGNTGKKGKGLFAKHFIKKGSMVFVFSKGKVLPIGKSTQNSLQINDRYDLESRPTHKFENLLNHSCNPNCYIKYGNSIKLIALRNIKAKEELSFNYNSAEYDLIRDKCSFNCYCGSKNCIGFIKGFKYLTSKQRKSIKSILAPYLRAKLTQK